VNQLGGRTDPQVAISSLISTLRTWSFQREGTSRNNLREYNKPVFQVYSRRKREKGSNCNFGGKN